MGFSYVFIPCDNDAIQERTFEGTAELQDDGFVAYVKKFFAQKGQGVNTEVLLENMAAHTKKDVAELKSSVDDKMLEKLATLQTIDIFPIQVPTKEVGFHGVSLYCDDKGIAKNLEMNERAMGLVRACGYTDQQFRGDVFLGRIYDKEEDAWRRIDFTLKDCSSDAVWVKQVQEQRKSSNANSAQNLQSLQNTLKMENPAEVTSKGASADASAKFRGEADGYRWSDLNREEVCVVAKKEGLTKGDIKVVFKPKRLKVQVQSEVICDVELFARVVAEECTWTVLDGCLELTLVKEIPEQTWNALAA